MLLCVSVVASMAAGCGKTNDAPADAPAADDTADNAADADDTADDAADNAEDVSDAADDTADDSASDSSDGEKLVVGFAQIGQESGWRDGETMSIQTYAEVRPCE